MFKLKENEKEKENIHTQKEVVNKSTCFKSDSLAVAFRMGHLKTVYLRACDEGLRAVIKERGGGKNEKAATEMATQF